MKKQVARPDKRDYSKAPANPILNHGKVNQQVEGGDADNDEADADPEEPRNRPESPIRLPSL